MENPSVELKRDVEIEQRMRYICVEEEELWKSIASRRNVYDH